VVELIWLATEVSKPGELDRRAIRVNRRFCLGRRDAARGRFGLF